MNVWLENPKKVLKECQDNLKFPMFVKPATLGSSIGINKATDEDSLSFAIEVASVYCDRILVEECFENVFEVNCSALGYKSVEASVCEMPVASGDALTFKDKYMTGGSKGSKGVGMASLSRVIPAPISAKLTKQIQETTVKIFKELGGCGVARIDYFVDKKSEKLWVNEINSPPGSLAYYLWEKSGLKYKELLNRLVDFALERSKDREKTQYVFESGLLQIMAEGKSAINK